MIGRNQVKYDRLYHSGRSLHEGNSNKNKNKNKIHHHHHHQGVNYLLLVYENSDILNLLRQILYFVEVENRRKKKSVSLRLDVK